jgi:hypothetical protein
MGRRRRLQARAEIDVVDRQLPEQRAERDQQDHRRQDDQADHGQPMAAETPPRFGRRRDVAQARRNERRASDS